MIAILVDQVHDGMTDSIEACKEAKALAGK